MNKVSFGRRIAQNAAAHPEATAIVYAKLDGTEIALSWEQFDRTANQCARLLSGKGVDQTTLVVVALPTGVTHVVSTIAAWRLGACVLPVNPDAPALERKAIVEAAAKWRVVIVIGETVPGVATVSPDDLSRASEYDYTFLVDKVPCPGKAICSGGSTGRPKIILDSRPLAYVPGQWGGLTKMGLRDGQTVFIASRMHHTMGFFLAHVALFENARIVIPERFEPESFVDLVERYRVNFFALLPIMMQRVAKLPDLTARDFSSVESFYHSGGVCPRWAKEVWLTLVPPERQWEGYGATEELGQSLIRGDEWLRHPGSVGKPLHCDLRILDDDGHQLPSGQVGEIYMKQHVDSLNVDSDQSAWEYVGAPPIVTTVDGFKSVGDLGWVDEGGYLFIADRRIDMIKSGGANVYPAEVESALALHSNVQDVVVFGLPDDEWGQRVHALVQPGPLTGTRQDLADILDSFCREQLTSYKVPKSYEFVLALPRDSSGKIRRVALRDARASGWTDDMVRPLKRDM